MTISEVVALLQKVNQVAGDIPVAIKAAEGGAESVLQSLNIHIPAIEGGQPVVHLVHSQAPAGSGQLEPQGTSGIPAA